MKLLRHKQTGFTVVELLIVIVVIGILASITIVAYNGVQTRARALAIVNGIKNIESSLQLVTAEQKMSQWWRDTTLATPSDPADNPNPTFDDIIAQNSSIKEHLGASPSVSGLSLIWYYDNDLDVRSPTVCNTSWTGVVIGIRGVDREMIKAVNDILDTDSATDTDLTCGRVRSGNAAYTQIVYQLSFTQAIE